MTQADLHRLALGIHATTGIEVLVWLTDIAGLPREDAVEIMYSSARALAGSAIADGATPYCSHGAGRPRRAPTTLRIARASR